MHTLAAALMLLALAAACGGAAGGGEDEMAVWDLRETHSTEAVGWGEDAGSAFEARSEEGLERILLPEGVVIDGRFRANPSRDGGLRDQPHEDHLRSLTVTFASEPVDDVLDRARHYAQQFDVELGDLAGWAARNRDDQDLGPGGASALSGRAVLGEVELTAQLEAQSLGGGEGVLRVILVWPREAEDTP